MTSEAAKAGTEFDVQCGWEDLIYDLSPGVWRCAQSYEDDKRVRALVVGFLNPLPTKGRPIERELIVRAHLKLSNPAQGIAEQVPTAWWLGEMGYRVNLGMGHSQKVILGHIENRRFYSPVNPYAFPGPNNDFDVPLRLLTEEKSVPLSDRVMIQVSIIRVDVSESVLEQVTFDLTPQMQGGWRVSRFK
jgi:hypothetical protein